jgi:hypothetical protein
MNITVSAYNRPEYLRQTLSALRACDGIDSCRVAVLIDLSDEAGKCADVATTLGFESFAYTTRVGCNAAIRHAFEYGFRVMRSEYHVHLEDDTVPTRDALRWFAWARDAYRDHARVMNVSGYQRVSNGCLDECGARRWFTPWGWGVWRDRWDGLAAGWVRDDATSWDVIVNHVLRAGRHEVFPTVSRIQNIGAEKGTHVPSAEWHTAHHRVAVTADDIEGKPVNEWRHVREAGRADHD